MTKTALINRRTLIAVNLAAPKKETRYYLRGVLVEIYPDHSIYVATDGHRMIGRRVNNPKGCEPNTLTRHFIIPSETIKTIKVSKAKYRVADNDWSKLNSGTDGSTNRFSLTDDVNTESGVVFAPLDGTFYDWRRFLPRSDPKREINRLGEKVAYNWSFLDDFQKAADILDIGAPDFKPFNDNGPELVRFAHDTDTFGVIMPLRSETPGEITAPDWADYRTQFEQAAE